MPELEVMNQEDFNQRGQELANVESQFLDGDYDQELFVQRIEQYKSVIGLSIYNMGRALLVLKANCAHGEFMPLLERMNLSQSSANKAMKLAAKFSTPKLQKLIQGFSIQKGLSSKLVALGLENDDDLESLVDGGSLAGLAYDDIDRMSHKELCAALRKAKADKKADKDANDRLLADKNTHADVLAKKLSVAQGLSEPERWKEQQAVFDKEMSAFSLDAEELLNAVHSLILTVNIPVDGELQSKSARKSMAIHTMNRVNALANKLGQMQNDVFAEFSEFINEPTYQLSDPLAIADEGVEGV